MSPQTAPVSLADIQHPLRVRLEKVQQELRRVVEADFGSFRSLAASLSLAMALAVGTAARRKS